MAIRGDHQEEAVLCTDKATFDLKMADTSNSLLLVPECALPKDEGWKHLIFFSSLETKCASYKTS